MSGHSQAPSPAAPGRDPTSSSSAGASGPAAGGGRSTDRAALRGKSFAEQEAALAPVQMKVDDTKDPTLTSYDPTGDTAALRSKDGAQSQILASESAALPSPTSKLPFNDKGWDGRKILDHLSQYDSIKETDSDNSRCVQASALATRVIRGPADTVVFLSEIVLKGLYEMRKTEALPADQEANENKMPKGLASAERKNAAAKVLNDVQKRILGKSATYGDLSWAMEAAHDIFFKDGKGAMGAEVMEQFAPGGKGAESYIKDGGEGTVVKSMADLEPFLKDLKPGEQLILNSKRVPLPVGDEVPAPFGHQFVVFNIDGKLVAYNPAAAGKTTEDIPDPKKYFGDKFTPKKGVESARMLVVTGKTKGSGPAPK